MMDWNEIDEEYEELATAEEAYYEYKKDKELEDDTEEQKSDSLSKFNWFNVKDVQETGNNETVRDIETEVKKRDA